MKKKFIILATLILILTIIGYFCSKYFTIEFLKAQKEYLNVYIQNHYIASIIVAMFLYAVIVLSTFPFTALCTVSCGFFFGVKIGSMITLIGATVGAVVSFLILRHFMGKDFQKHYEDKLEKFNHELAKYGIRYLIIVHLLMVVPFFVINLLAALSRISLWSFTWTTFIGLIPSTLIYTYAGSELSHLTSITDILSWKMLFAFLVVVGLILATILKDKLVKKV